MKRKLASIQRVLDVSPIEGADRIEKIKVLGWNLVAKKGEFNKGDLCVYFEIDSMLPKNDIFSFLFKADKKDRHRLRTVKLRGIISQGLALRLEDFKKIDVDFTTGDFEVGQEVTEELGVEKYLPKPSETPRNLDSFPFFVPKTDEQRIQSAPELLDELGDTECVVTVKLDGSSVTYAYRSGEFFVCSRNNSHLDLKEGYENYEFDPKRDPLYHLADKYNIKAKLESKGNYAIQGEMCGPKIQKNRLNLEGVDFFVFNVYNIDKGKYLDFQESIDFCNKLSLPFVPVMLKDITMKGHSVESLLMLAEGKYDGTENEREGIVIRPTKEMYSETLKGRLSFKAISNKYLLS